MKKALYILPMLSLLLLLVPAVSATVEKTDAAFVCPVITSSAVGEHNPVAGELGDSGTYTVVQGQSTHQMTVPLKATNGGGSGRPGVTEGEYAQSQPGDKDYTAIWSGQ